MQFNQLKQTAVGLAVAGLALAAGSAQAYEMTLDVAGIESRDGFGDPGNETRYLDLFAGARITGLAWNVTLFADSPSWLSEISVDLNDGGSAGVSLSPGFGSLNNASGTRSFTGSANLGSNAFNVGATGRLFLEFFETFDDFAGVADGAWRSGSLTVTYVPEPASFGLAAIALLGLGATSRRRRQLQG